MFPWKLVFLQLDLGLIFKILCLSFLANSDLFPVKVTFLSVFLLPMYSIMVQTCPAYEKTHSAESKFKHNSGK